MDFWGCIPFIGSPAKSTFGRRKVGRGVQCSSMNRNYVFDQLFFLHWHRWNQLDILAAFTNQTKCFATCTCLKTNEELSSLIFYWKLLCSLFLLPTAPFSRDLYLQKQQYPNSNGAWSNNRGNVFLLLYYVFSLHIKQVLTHKSVLYVLNSIHFLSMIKHKWGNMGTVNHSVVSPEEHEWEKVTHTPHTSKMAAWAAPVLSARQITCRPRFQHQKLSTLTLE